MDPNDPGFFLLQAIIGGIVETVAGKALEVAPRLAPQAQALLGKAQQRPLRAVDAAVRDAVAAARQDVVAAYHSRDSAFDDAVARDMVALLDHPPFAEEVARILVFHGQPDFERLHNHYLTAGDGDPARWQTLEEPLLDFFDAIKSHLQADPTLGPLLRETARLATLARLEQGTALIAELSGQAVDLQTRIAAHSAEGVAGIATLVQLSGRQEAHLAQLVELMTQVLAADDPDAPPVGGFARPSAAEHPYLRLLREECNRLPLSLTAGKRGGAQGAGQQPALSNVYVDLQVTLPPTPEQVLARLAVPDAEWPALRRTLGGDARHGAPSSAPGDVEEMAAGWRQLDLERLRRDKDAWNEHPLRPWAKEPETLAAALAPLLALEAFAAQPQMVLLGNPGSGKSTLVNHLAYTLASGRLGAMREWQQMLHGTFARPLLPLRIILRRWSASLHAHDPHGLELAYRALEALPTGLTRSELVVAIERGEVLVLFDGLDETPITAGDDGHGLDRRRRIVEAVSAFCTAHAACPVLVTSRVKPYTQADSPYKLGLPTCELAALDDPRVETFIERWYGELALRDPLRTAEAARNRDRLLEKVRSNRDLRELADTPLLLTMLARVNAGQPLPEARAALYHECVEQLLYDWDELKAEDVRNAGSGMADAAAAAPLTLERLLAESGVARKRADFERVLWEVTYHAHEASGRRQADLPAAVLEQKLATLHQDRHAGKQWASRVVEFIGQHSGLLIEHEPGVFSFPHPSFQEYLTARWLLEQERCPQQAAEKAEQDHWREVILLACGYLATSANAFNRLVDIVSNLAECAVDEPRHWPRLLVAGQAWREFDGRRREVNPVGNRLRRQIPEQLTQLMQLRAASAIQRRDAGLLAAAVADPPPELDGAPRLVAIAGFDDGARRYDFQIGQYPVTNAQFSHFMSDGGYDKTQAWWSEQAIAELERTWGEWPTAPRWWEDERFNSTTQPVVGVTWYEAAAYCAWLAVRWRDAGRIGPDWEVRLPTLAEWEFVAAGPGNRTWAWGDSFDPACANTQESKLGQPTPVHMYPASATPADTGHAPVYDLCGNVWEWTSTRSGTRDWLWLKGGAFHSDAEGATAAARVVGDPGGRGWVDGFRVVLVPCLSPSSGF